MRPAHLKNSCLVPTFSTEIWRNLIARSTATIACWMNAQSRPRRNRISSQARCGGFSTHNELFAFKNQRLVLNFGVRWNIDGIRMTVGSGRDPLRMCLRYVVFLPHVRDSNRRGTGTTGLLESQAKTIDSQTADLIAHVDLRSIRNVRVPIHLRPAQHAIDGDP